MSISVEHLSKHYRVHEREPGLGGAIRSLFNRQFRLVKAVDDVSFTIEPGEIVGFLGPNGAGKTTTIKVLAGLLWPTSGSATVAGFTPFTGGDAYKRRFSLVMGQKSQLLWDLPAMETFFVNQAIYEVEEQQFKQTVHELTEMLAITHVLNKPVRNLSLGERMKCELVAALLHRPQILFLDEPTIGLDVSSQETVRSFIREYNARHGATVILTSHYMADVTALCKRILIINRGRLLYDGAMEALVERLAPYKVIRLALAAPADTADLAAFGEVQSHEGARAVLHAPRAKASEVSAALLQRFSLLDINIEDPPIEDVLGQAFAEGAAHGAADD